MDCGWTENSEFCYPLAADISIDASAEIYPVFCQAVYQPHLVLCLQCLTTATGTMSCRGMCRWAATRDSSTRCCRRTSGRWPSSCGAAWQTSTWSTWSAMTPSRPSMHTSVTSRQPIPGTGGCGRRRSVCAVLPAHAGLTTIGVRTTQTDRGAG